MSINTKRPQHPFILLTLSGAPTFLKIKVKRDLFVRTSMMTKVCFQILAFLVLLQQACALLPRTVQVRQDSDGNVYIKSGAGRNIVIQPGYGGKVIINGRLQVCEANGCRDKLGSRKNPASSCNAILEDDPFAESGVYYIVTEPYVTKVYCYMENIPGCGGGGWTTIMKTDGHKSTFKYNSALWGNKDAYQVTGGQSGVDHQETKLPTYWTMPFSSLCLGMKTAGQSDPFWIRLNYTASSLYSVIADGRYRNFSIGRNAWKSLVQGSSLQLNCNKEGFNFHVSKYHGIRIGILGNQENNCKTPDSRIGFGGVGDNCGSDGSVSTGNTASCSPDNGSKTIKTYGYILAQKTHHAIEI